MQVFVKNDDHEFKFPYVLSSEPEADGSYVGRFHDVTRTDLLPMLQPSLDGTLVTYRPTGKRQRIVDLMAEGQFRLVNDYE